MAVIKKGTRKEIHCDKTISRRTQDGDCINSNIDPNTGKCKKGHTAGEYTEADLKELEGFNILSKSDINTSEKKPKDLPRTPKQIYDDVLSRN